MSRIRSIKPEFWTSEQVVECSTNARLLFIGLWNFCDDHGRHTFSPKQIKALIFPADDLTADAVEDWLGELVAQNLILRYTVDGKEYLQVTGWHHQKIDKRQLAKFPAPSSIVSGPDSDSSTNGRRTVSTEGNTEGNTEPERKSPHSLAQSRRKKGGGDFIDQFEKFWSAFPDRAGMSEGRAFSAFMRLSAPDQQAAIASLLAFTTHVRKKPTTHPLSAEKYLDERRFDGFAPQPVSGEPKVFVKHGTPEWKLWDAHWRAKNGTGPPCGKDGWHFPSLVPPLSDAAGKPT